MASWVTHLMVADQIMKEAKGLDRHGFCVGNIAPDCNVENEDWTFFVPSRETTPWMKAEYLQEHPDSGYLTEIIPLKDFPDYIDYLSQGCIVRKIRIMGQIPELDESIVNLITISREKLDSFVYKAAELVLYKFREKGSIMHKSELLCISCCEWREQ